ATISVGPKPVNLTSTSRCIMSVVMRSGTPRAVADVLAAAVPQIAERLPEYRIRTAWRSLVGVDIARRTRPLSLSNGCLHVVVDSPRGLNALTLPAAEWTGPLPAHSGAARWIRFPLGPPRADPPPPAARRPRGGRTPKDADRRDIEAAA